MGCILSLETSTSVCSVAVHRDGKLTGVCEVHVDKSHSELITLLVDRVLDYSGINRQQLDAVAVAEGPGSYTGLRIGVSTAKGICYGLDIPLISVNTLKAMASGINRYNTFNTLLCPMLDARRMEVYTSVLNASLEWIKKPWPLVVDEHAFEDVLNEESVVFFGNGMPKSRPFFKKKDHAFFIDDIEPSAAFVGEEAEKYYQEGWFADLAYFEPFYLKEFRATKPKKLI